MSTPIARVTLSAASLMACLSLGSHPHASPASQESQDFAAGRSRRYVVETLDSLGGNRAIGNSVNDRGWIAGFSNLEDNQVSHAALWIDDELLDLGTLGGPGTSSNINWPVKNNHGLLSGFAETDEMNPLGEDWSCSAFFPTTTKRICLGVFWEFGKIHPLPTLGGYNGFAAGANNHGQIVGWAENMVRDPTCLAPQVLQFRAVLWEPRRHRMRELPPLPLTGDSVSAATVINDRGQVAGISGICDVAVGRFSARHAVLWERDGSITNLGTLGGVAWITPMAINNRGVVVGFSNINASDGGTLFAHPFRWTRETGMRPLDLLPGDERGQALGINDRGDIVGLSCPPRPGLCKAVLWTHGTIVDLNDVVQPGFAEHLASAGDINDRGVITGQTRNDAANTRLTFRATPRHRFGHDHDDDDDDR